MPPLPHPAPPLGTLPPTVNTQQSVRSRDPDGCATQQPGGGTTGPRGTSRPRLRRPFPLEMSVYGLQRALRRAAYVSRGRQVPVRDRQSRTVG